MSNGLGLSASGMVRELLIANKLCDYETACRVSEQFDAMAMESDWLELLNGTMFTKSFVPNARQPFNGVTLGKKA